MEVLKLADRNREIKEENSNLQVEERLKDGLNLFKESEYYASLKTITRFGMYLDNKDVKDWEGKQILKYLNNQAGTVESQNVIFRKLVAPLFKQRLNTLSKWKEQLRLEFKNLVLSEVWTDLNNAFHGQSTLHYLELLYGESQRYPAFWNTEYALGMYPYGLQSGEINMQSSEYRLLQAAAITHDWAEAIKGDIRFDLKTDADTKIEKIIYKQLLDQYLLGYTEEEKLILCDIVHGPDSGRQSLNPKLQEIFKLVERIGYYYSGIHAWLGYKIIIPEFEDNYPKNPRMNIYSDACDQMAANVFLNQISPMVDAVKKFPAVGHTLFNTGHILKDLITSNSENQQNLNAFKIYPVEDPNPRNTRSSKINQFNAGAGKLISYFNQDNKNTYEKYPDLNSLYKNLSV